MNPFLTIWTKPNETLRYIIEEKTHVFGILVTAIASLSSSVFLFADIGIMESFSLTVILLLSIVLSVVFSVLFYFINGGIYLLIGKILGGQGRYKEVCLAAASGSLPSLAMLPISMLAVALYGKDLYREPVDMFAITNMSPGFYLFYTLVMLGLSIYGIVILSKGLGYAHQFSALRGFGAVAIYTGIVVVISIMIIVLLAIGAFVLLGF